MNKLFAAIVATVFLAVALNAQEARYVPQQVLSTTWTATNAVVGGATSNLNFTIDVRKQQNLGVAVSYKLTGSGTETATLTFNKSIDGSTFNTHANANLTITLPANGTTTATTVTNLDCKGIGYLRLATILNGSAGETMTNIVIKYSTKMNAP